MKRTRPFSVVSVGGYGGDCGGGLCRAHRNKARVRRGHEQREVMSKRGGFAAARREGRGVWHQGVSELSLPANREAWWAAGAGTRPLTHS